MYLGLAFYMFSKKGISEMKLIFYEILHVYAWNL